MPYLMIRNNPALFLAHNPVFLLFSNQHHFYRFKQILLPDYLPAVLYGIDGGFIDHIRQVRPHCAGGCQRDCFQVHRLIHLHVFGMYFQRINPAFQIRLIHNNPPVKPSRTQKRRIQNLRAVCRR